jgi:hypothetical protein
MDYSSVLQTVGGVAGLGGLALGVLLLIYRDVIRKNIFSSLTKEQSYGLMRLIIVLTFAIAVLGLIAWAYTSAGRTYQSNNGIPATASPGPVASPSPSQTDSSSTPPAVANKVSPVTLAKRSPKTQAPSPAGNSPKSDPAGGRSVSGDREDLKRLKEEWFQNYKGYDLNSTELIDCRIYYGSERTLQEIRRLGLKLNDQAAVEMADGYLPFVIRRPRCKPTNQ